MSTALGGQPWRGYSKIELDAGVGSRHYHLSVDDVGHSGGGDQSTWEGTPGSSLTLRLEWTTDGAPGFGQATTATVVIRLPGSGTDIGTFWSPAISGDNGVATRTFHFDDNPLDESAGTARAGLVEMVFSVQRTTAVTWGPVDSQGGGTPPTGVLAANFRFARGYLRAPFTLSSESLSNASLGGAEPSLWAYPDQVFARANLDAVSFRATAPTFSIRDSGSPIRSKAAASGTGTQKDVSLTAAAERLDAAFDVDVDDVRWAFAAQDFGGDDEHVFAASGHAAGWSRTGASGADLRSVDDAARMDIDTRVTLDQFTITTYLATTIHNRGQAVSGSVRRRNARAEAFTALGTERLRSVDVDSAAIESTASLGTITAGVIPWTVTFATGGNAATSDVTNRVPADAGKAKKLRWDDQGATTSPTADTGTYGRLSSSYRAVPHMQLNNNVHDPALATTFRQNSDLGFVTLRIADRRGGFVNGVGAANRQINLKDDANFVSAIQSSGSISTATRNGFAGFFPFIQWDSQLPGGRWDLWINDGSADGPTGSPDGQLSHNGNTAVLPRQGAGLSDLTLLAPNPNIEPLPGSGPALSGGLGDHWNVSEDLVVGVTLKDTQSGTLVQPDTDIVPSVGMMRFNQANGRAEWLDPADNTWYTVPTAAEDPSFAIDHFDLSASPSDARIYLRTFAPADLGDMSGFGDLFVVYRTRYQGTPFNTVRQIEVLDTANRHDRAIEISLFAGVFGAGTDPEDHITVPVAGGSGFFVITAQAFDKHNQTTPSPDLDGAGEPKCFVIIMHSGDAAAGAEPGTRYLDSDGTWRSLETEGPPYEFQMEESTLTTGRCFLSFPAIPGVPQTEVTPDTSTWRNDKDISVLVRIVVDNTTYTGHQEVGFVGNKNKHTGYAVDPLALAGVLPTR